MPSCLIIVENLPVPLDRRTWQEAQALYPRRLAGECYLPQNVAVPKGRRGHRRDLCL